MIVVRIYDIFDVISQLGLMKNLYQTFRFLLFLGLLISFQAHSQEKEYRFFTATAGVNFIDDSNQNRSTPTFSDMNFSTPVMLGLEGRISESFSWTVHLTGNELDINDGRKLPFFGVDAMFNWYLDSMIWNNNDLEWSLGGGTGYYSLKGERARPTANIGSTFRWWFLDWMGISLQGTAKLGLSSVSTIENYYQYNLGVVFGIKAKPKNEVPEEDNTSELEEMSSETQTQQPPVAVQSTEIDDNDEAASATTNGPIPIVVESVYFDRNSSFLESSETKKLDLLINMLNKDPELRVEIETYTDSSGRVAYNDWLARQRLNRTADYLTSRNILASRIDWNPIGVDPNSEECVDCTVEDQRQFRRAEFRVYKKE